MNWLKETGKALPDVTIDAIKNSDACLKAPVGECARDVIVVLRKMLDLYANIRPAKSYPHMPALRDDIDLVIVRENTEDLYTGQEFSVGDSAVALRIISVKASKRIAKYAFETAMQRDSMRKVTCVHKLPLMPSKNLMRVSNLQLVSVHGMLLLYYVKCLTCMQTSGLQNRIPTCQRFVMISTW